MAWKLFVILFSPSPFPYFYILNSLRRNSHPSTTVVVYPPVLRLPPSIERRLSEIFPDKADREHFVARVIEDALQGREPSQRSIASMPIQAAMQIPLAPAQASYFEEDEQEMFHDDMAAGGTLHLFTDGGSRGNPGQASIACILEDPKRGVLLKEYAEQIGIETNNVAEYKALIKGLEIAQSYHPNRLICHMDSELIVRQLSGQYQVKMLTLQPLFEKVKQLSQHFPDILFRHIPRSDNHRADALVNKVLNEQRPTYERSSSFSRGVF